MAERAAFALAALSWGLLCVRWFDAAAPLRPRALEAVPPWLLATGVAAGLALALRAQCRAERRAGSGPAPAFWLVLGLALLFRLPMVWQGAAGLVTADGALSGLMALDVRDGRAHDVFVPHVPYSGSLKAHLTAPLAAVMDPARAFALVSALFYVAFVAALYRLGERAAAGGTVPRDLPLVASLFAAFSPPFVTRYSLSNDGNYVEVLALGTWALLVAVRLAGEPYGVWRRGFLLGALLGLAFWCHILAVIPALAVAAFVSIEAPRRALAALSPALFGFALGFLPGLLWNAANGWDSFAYLRPGAAVPADAAASPGPLGKLAALATDHLPVLLGRDFGYPPAIDRLLTATAVTALVLLLAGAVGAVGPARAASGGPWRLVLLFAAVNMGLAALALPYIPGNPRYLLFSMAPFSLLLARAAAWRAGRVALAFVVASGAVASSAQGLGAVRPDRQWRALIGALEGEGVRWCYTDFFLATKINFLSGQRVTCSAKLGPTTTEYFFRFREAVDAAPEAALVAVNATSAEKLERRLERLGVTYDRRDLMKPVLLRLSRKVGPEELFPDRSFPLR